MSKMDEAEIELKKYEARMALWRTGVLGGLATILVAIVSGLVSVIISSQETKRELEIQQLRGDHEVNLRKIEIDNAQVASFMDHALSENIGLRLRFTEYLSIMTASTAQRERWKEYHRLLLEQERPLKAEVGRLEEKNRQSELDRSSRSK